MDFAQQFVQEMRCQIDLVALMERLWLIGLELACVPSQAADIRTEHLCGCTGSTAQSDHNAPSVWRKEDKQVTVFQSGPSL